MSVRRFLTSQNIPLYILIGIMVVAIFLRFYNMPYRYGLDMDPTRDILISLYGAEQFILPLTGPPSGVAPFSFGPWYYYQLIVAQMIIPGGFGPWIHVGVLSVMSVVVMYYIGKELGGRFLGLILALFSALSPAELGPTTGLSNPNLVPLHASLAILFFLWVVKNKVTFWHFVVWGFVIGVGISHHYQAAGLLVLPIIAFIYKRSSIRRIGAFILGLLIASLPIILFNILSDYHTVRGVWFYIFDGSTATYIPNSWRIYVLDFWVDFWSYVFGVPHYFGIILFGLAAGISLFLAIKRQVDRRIILLFVGFMVNVLIWRYFPGERFYYYFLYLHPFLFILLGWVLWRTLKNRFAVLVIAVFVVAWGYFLIPEDIRRLNPERKYLDLENKAEQIMAGYQEAQLEIYHCGSHDRHEAQAVAFFLSRKERLGDEGGKIGIHNRSFCEENTQEFYIEEIQAYDFSILSAEELARRGWFRITPESVYQETVSSWKY